MDRRDQLNWQQRLPARIGTAALWLGSLSLLGPLKVSAVLLAGALAAPAVLLLERGRRSPGLMGAPSQTSEWLTTQTSPVLSRAMVAAELGVPEWQLFRARHASLCLVQHDASGSIVALQVPEPAAQHARPTTNAHPVG